MKDQIKEIKFFRGYFCHSSFQDKEYLEENYPLRFPIWYKFLEKIYVIPFLMTPIEVLKTEFPEGEILLLGSRSKIVIIFERDLKKRCR